MFNLQRALMLRLMIVLAICFTVGCEAPQPKKPTRPHKMPTRTLGEIVLITRDDCIWCEKQKKVLGEMDLNGWSLWVFNHSNDAEARSKYPAPNGYPTMYVTVSNGGSFVVDGFRDQNQMERILGM